MNAAEGKNIAMSGTDKNESETKNMGEMERKVAQSFGENQTSHTNPNDASQQASQAMQQPMGRTNPNFSQQPTISGGPQNTAAFHGYQAAQSGSFPSEERYHLLFERETRWSEVRKYSEFIRRFATEASHMEITKENYYDLYNMAVCLLKSVDSLDPDKIHNAPQRKGSDFDLGSQMPATPQIPVSSPAMAHPSPMPSELELLQARKSFDYYYNQSSPMNGGGNYIPKYSGEVPLFYNNPTVPAFMNTVTPSYPTMPKSDGVKQPKNFSGEVFFDDLQQQQDDGTTRRPKRRRRRTVYSSRRNLHCHMCGVTETPEWRRGPAGDHTLCNACGLHYAKSLKKQRKEREGRKHSIEMLLNNKQSNPNPNNEAT